MPRSIEGAIAEVRARFPFEGYMFEGKGSYASVAATLRSCLAPGSRVLDFGAGPCDVTAVAQALGYRCSAYDDLRDEWHEVEGNRERILSFAREAGIDYRMSDGGPLPFERGSFDLVMCHDVLEHLHDSPRPLLLDLLELVRPEGLFLCTVPNAGNLRKRLALLFGGTNLPSFEYYYWYPAPFRGHVREYVRGDLAHMANLLDLEIVELRGCTHMGWRVPKALRPAYRLATRIVTGWCDTWRLLARKRPDWSPTQSLSPAERRRVLGGLTSYRYR